MLWEHSDGRPARAKPRPFANDEDDTKHKMGTVKTICLRCGDPVWDAVLADKPHDVYQEAGYNALCAAQDSGEAFAFWAQEGENGFFVPFIKRRVPEALGVGDTLYDATSAYGYPGALVWPATSPDVEFVSRAVNAFVIELRGLRVVTGFFRLHPLLNSSPSQFSSKGWEVTHGQTIAIDLSKGDEHYWREMRDGHRYDIKRLQRDGFSVRQAEYSSECRLFTDAYEENMRRVRAKSYYFFEHSYYKRLKEALEERLCLFLVECKGEVCGGALFTECKGIVQYHLSGMYAKYARANPTKLMLHEVRQWAKQRGNHWMHLGGGVGNQADSLFDFKAGFSRERFTFRTWRVVIDPEAYRDLTRSAVGEDKVGGDEEGFFPRYRLRREAPSDRAPRISENASS